MKLTELTGKTALKAIEDMLDEQRLRIHALELKVKSLEKVKKEKPMTKTFDDYVSEWKTLYYWVDIEKELAKMDGWLRLHPERKKTPRFCVNWLNKNCGEKPFEQPKNKPVHPSHEVSKPVAERKIVREVDVEHEKKVALWKSLPEEEQKRRMSIAKDHYKNNQFFQMSSEDVKKKLLTGKVLEAL